MSKTRIFIVLPILFAYVCASAHALDVTAASTTTKLTISPREVGITVPVALTVRVLVGTMPVRHWAIVFCDTNAARCQGLAILRTA
jgi:hypothetical protein